MKTLIMGVLLSTVLSGCQSMPTMPVARAAVAAPLGPPLEVGYCIDTTASVGHALIGPGKALLVRHLEALVHPGFPGLHLHLRRIGHDSWSPSAELVTALIPPVHAYPAPPQISYWDAATLRAHKLALYRQGRARVDGELGAARAVLRSTERQIAALDLQIEHNTDVNGCAAKFAIDLWAGMVGPHSLTILSDLAPQGANTPVVPHFQGRTAITVVLYCSGVSDAGACEARKERFGQQMWRDGATSYQAYDYQNIAFIPVPH
jgi:hypothetical protein